MYILEVIKVVFSLFQKNHRIKFVLLNVFFLLSALIQIVGVASIGPFIAILSSPQTIHSNGALSFLYAYFNFANDNEFIVASAVASLVMILVSNSVSIATLWLLMRFSVFFGVDLQARLFTNFIGRPYIYHKMVNYTKPISVIAQEAPRYVYMVLQPVLLLLSNIFIALVILLGLLMLNPFIALGSGFIIGGAYLATYIGLKRSLAARGKILTECNSSTQAILSEVFMGIKDIILNSIGERYAKIFRKINMRGQEASTFITLSGDVPKFFIETISFGAILLLAIVLLIRAEPPGTIVSLLSIYALAGYKLLPTLQQVYKSIATIGAHGSVAFSLVDELNSPSTLDRLDDMPALDNVDEIRLEGLSYVYPGATSKALDGITLTFTRGKLNTIAGHSGSGKSTLVDVVLGLLKPETGRVLVDKQVLTEATRARYQKSIGYLPQHVFVLDDSVVANVAFGVSKEEINLDKVLDALTKANAIGFVNALPNGLESNLGQDGKLLSGGQRQRIGIARCLYRDTKILILDEPTSALDIESEFDFMTLLGDLKNEILTIVISHRPAAIKCSDVITLMEQGSVSASGAYSFLIDSNASFKSMMDKSSVT